MARRRSTETLDLSGLSEALNLTGSSSTSSQELSDSKWIKYQCELVTPLYGGGVDAGQIDKDMPIRASEIRGHLRFWWRLLYGNPEDSHETFKKECAIWGGIGKDGAVKSRVDIKITNVEGLKVEPAFEYVKNQKKQGELKPTPNINTYGERYSLFPAQGKLSEDKRSVESHPHGVAIPGLSFTLQIAFNNTISPIISESQIKEVKQSLRWWANFGGIGARTRRGLGAVQVKKLDPITAAEVSEKGGKLQLANWGGDASTNWRQAISRLQEFRQGEYVGRMKRSANSLSPAGESHWPEADSLRNLTKQYATYRKPTDKDLNLFPRAAFGLPIIFHFKDRGDPEDQSLEPADINGASIERMASPLILRPYWDGKKWQAAAFLLPNWQRALDQELKLRNSNKKPNHWNRDKDQQGPFISAASSPINGRGASNPLTAFLDYFEKGK